MSELHDARTISFGHRNQRHIQTTEPTLWDNAQHDSFITVVHWDKTAGAKARPKASTKD